MRRHEPPGDHVKLRRLVATVTVAALFFAAPSLIPLPVKNAPVRLAAIPTCGVPVVWRTPDTAEALPITPCPVYAHSMGTPWAVIGVGAAAVSVIVNGIIISQTQCRELTQQEAFASIFLPFLGMAFDEHHSHCH